MERLQDAQDIARLGHPLAEAFLRGGCAAEGDLRIDKDLPPALDGAVGGESKSRASWGKAPPLRSPCRWWGEGM